MKNWSIPGLRLGQVSAQRFPSFHLQLKASLETQVLLPEKNQQCVIRYILLTKLLSGKLSGSIWSFVSKDCLDLKLVPQKIFKYKFETNSKLMVGKSLSCWLLPHSVRQKTRVCTVGSNPGLSHLISLSSLAYSAIFLSCSSFPTANCFFNLMHSCFKARMLLA